MADWSVTSKNGRVIVYGRRAMVSGRWRDRLNWTDQSGKQRHSMVAVYEEDPDRAKRYAEDIAERESKGKTGVEMQRGDQVTLLAAKDALVGAGVSVDHACREYREALRILESSGGSIIDAAHEYKRNHGAKTITIENLESAMITELERTGKSKRYIWDMTGAFTRLKASFPEREFSSLTLAELENHLHSEKIEPKTFNNRRGLLCTIFNWAIKKDFAKVNPAAKIEKIKDKRTIHSYSAEDIAAILEKAPRDLLPWIVLQAFGCLRACEVARVEFGKHVILKRGIIRATNDLTKTGQTRIIELQPNAIAWLSSFDKEGPIYSGAEGWIGERNRKKLAKAIREAKVEPIPNGLRKTCASNLVPICDHIGEAAEMMGHTVSEMKRSYRELRSKDEAEAYWSIMPERPGNVTDISAAG